DGSTTVKIEGGVPPYIFEWQCCDSCGSVATTTPTFTFTGLCAGTYWGCIKDSAGMDTAYVTFMISEPVPLIVDTLFTTPDTSSQNNGTATISVSGGTSPYTYEWNNDTSLTDSVLMGLSAGVYTVTVTDNNGCILVNSVTVGSVTSINESLTLSSTIKLYPNPTTGILYIEMPKIGFATVFVLNLLGEIVVQMDNVNDFASLNLMELVVGAYFVKIQTSQQIFATKINVVK
ncbi:MAG: T9SS type A sorting domain-containing protein, partial [Bacteroidetes bacterium]|nr:T9SS type A sorting domain-containing protein [Bacteroidota bacterium]